MKSVPDPLPEEFDELVESLLHGELAREQSERLASSLAGSALARDRFLDHLLVKATVVEEARAGAFSSDPRALFGSIEEPAEPARETRPAAVRRRWMSLVAAGLAACLLIAFWIQLPGTAVAESTLERLVDAFGQLGDRSYLIHVEEDRRGRRDSPRPGGGRYPTERYLEGAVLHLRGEDQFVLEQDLREGGRRLSGSDGTSSWSVRGKGPVRVSADPRRFRGGIPGQQQDLAFGDLRAQLEDLRWRYKLRLEEHPEDPPTGGEALHRLNARKRGREVRGPGTVDLWFDPATGLIHHMFLAGLPRGHGAPRSVSLELLSTDPLPADFFSHSAHHEEGRAVEHLPRDER
jgi:hypothetical protein